MPIHAKRPQEDAPEILLTARYYLTAEIGRDPVLSILYGRSLNTDPEDYSLLHFYKLNKHFMISNSDHWELRSVWKKRFLNIAKHLNKETVSEIIVYLLITHF